MTDQECETCGEIPVAGECDCTPSSDDWFALQDALMEQNGGRAEL